MKRIAYCVLHYGKEYLSWALRAAQDAVDEIHIVYSDKPALGQTTTSPCPDNEADIRLAVHRFLRKPTYWHTGRWYTEAAKRDEAIKIAKERGALQILSVDADEVWDAETLQAALDVSSKRLERNIHIRPLHFWRSFNWVCKDDRTSPRIINVHGAGDWTLEDMKLPVMRFGYAQSKDLLRYRETVYAKTQYWRVGWFDYKFAKWTPDSGIKDVHPIYENRWTPEPTDPEVLALAKKLLHDHPYRDLDLIP
jgi:hypothetical protein